MERIRLKQVLVVEGKYDQIKLNAFIDAPVFTTKGFSIFKDKKMQTLLRRLSKEKGLIILTDSDKAGFKIRHFLKSIARDGEVIHVYIPDVFGKEKRKQGFSKEGKLGVEGLSITVLKNAFEKAGIFTDMPQPENKRMVTKYDFYEDQLTGCPNAYNRRKKLMAALDLPEHLSANALLDILNCLMDYDAYKSYIRRIQ